LEERAPRQLKLDGDEALAELVLRYFRSRGPATVADLAWWGGMNLGEARRGLAMVDRELEREVVDGAVFWWGGGKVVGAAETVSPEAVLLPAFDEYAVAYGDRGRLVAAEHLKESSHGLKPVVLVRGKVAGIWKRKIEKGKAAVEIRAWGKWSKAVVNQVKREARRYGAFAGDGRAAVEVVE
jgi:hypothetical protein